MKKPVHSANGRKKSNGKRAETGSVHFPGKELLSEWNKRKLRSLLLIFLLFPLFLQAQEETETDTSEEKGPAPWYGLRFTHAEYSGNPYMRSVDFRLRPFINDHFFLNYHAGLGKAWGSSFHVSSHAGLATGVNLLSNLENDSSSLGKTLRVISVLAIFVPEGVGYYKPLSPRFSIAPFANLLSYDYRKNEDRDIEHFYLSAEAGVEGHFHLNKKINIELRVGIKPIYTKPDVKMDSRTGGELTLGINYRARD